MFAKNILSRLRNFNGSSVLESTSAQKFLASYYGLRDRDQWALKILVTFLLLVLVFAALVRPAQNYAYHARDEAARNQQTLLWMHNNRALVSAKTNAQQVDSQSLLRTASAAAKDMGLSFTRFEPVDDAAMRVWLESANFNAMVEWIESLDTRFSIAVKELQLDSGSAGNINASLILQPQ